MDHDSSEIHVAEAEGKDWETGRRPKDEDRSRYDERSAEVTQAIRKPCQQVQRSTLVCGEDVAQVGTVEDVFKRGEDFNPDRRSPFRGDKSVKDGISLELS